MPITATLAKNSSKILKGGGHLWVVTYDPTLSILTPHATIDQDYAAEAPGISVYSAVTGEWEATEWLYIRVCNGAAVFAQQYDSLGANIFNFHEGLYEAVTKGTKIRMNLVSGYAEADFKHLGYLAEEGTEIAPKISKEPVWDEELELAKILFGEEEFDVVSNLLQTGKPELDFVLDEMREMTFAARYVTKIPNGGNQFWLFPKVQIEPMAAMKCGAEKRITAIKLHMLYDDIEGKSWALYEG